MKTNPSPAPVVPHNDVYNPFVQRFDKDSSVVAPFDQALGPAESLRFLGLLAPGSGDYTADRQTSLDQHPSTVDELCDKIRTARTATQTPCQ